MIYNYVRSLDKVHFRGFITRSQFELLEYAITYKIINEKYIYMCDCAPVNCRGFEKLICFKSQQMSQQGAEGGWRKDLYFHDVMVGYKFHAISQKIDSYCKAKGEAQKYKEKFVARKGNQAPVYTDNCKYILDDCDREVREVEVIYNPNKGKLVDNGNPTLLAWVLSVVNTMSKLNGMSFTPYIRKWDIADDYSGDMDNLVVANSRKINGSIYYGNCGEIETIYDSESGEGTKFYSVPDCRVSEASTAIASNFENYSRVQSKITELVGKDRKDEAMQLAREFKPPHPNYPVPQSYEQLRYYGEAIANSWYEHHIIRKEQTFIGKIFISDIPAIQYRGGTLQLPPSVYGFTKLHTPLDYIRFIKSIGGMNRNDICSLFFIMTCGWKQFEEAGGKLNNEIKNRLKRYLDLLSKSTRGQRTIQLTTEVDRKNDVMESENVVLAHMTELNNLFNVLTPAQICKELDIVFDKCKELHTPKEKEELTLEESKRLNKLHHLTYIDMKLEEQREERRQSERYQRLYKEASRVYDEANPALAGTPLSALGRKQREQAIEKIITKLESDEIFKEVDHEEFKGIDGFLKS